MARSGPSEGAEWTARGGRKRLVGLTGGPTWDSLTPVEELLGKSMRVRNLTRWGGLLMLCLFLLGQVSGMLHFAFVQHTTCHVDGELAHGAHHEHAGEHAGAHMHEAGSHAHEAQPEGPVLGQAEDEEHDEHCSLPTSRDDRKSLSTKAPLHVAPLQRVRNAVSLRSQSVEGGIPLFRLAPKQSPPHAG